MGLSTLEKMTQRFDSVKQDCSMPLKKGRASGGTIERRRKMVEFQLKWHPEFGLHGKPSQAEGC